MDNHDQKTEANARSLWVPIRRALLTGFGALIGGFVVWLALRPEPKINDRYSYVYASINQAEKLALTCHYKQPARLADLHWIDRDLKDAWGTPFRYAVVPNDAGEPEHYVWSEWTQDDGRVALIGAKATADGKTTMFGLPPKD
jgi:hypothetical protein